MSGVKTTTVSPEVFNDLENFKAPSTWYFVNALGDRVYVHCRNRSKAIEYVKEEYSGKYSIRTESQGKSGEITCRGSVNSASRKGSYQKKIFQNQFRD